MTDEERAVKLIDSAMASATRIERARCLRAVMEEPEVIDCGGFVDVVTARIAKANIRKRIEEGV